MLRLSLFKNIKAPLLMGALLLDGCATSPAAFDVERALPGLDLASVPVCSGYSCATRTEVGISTAEWQTIEVLFRNPAASPAIERTQVAKATGLFEILTGAKAGTLGDRPLSPFFIGTRGQLDCLDEAFNTSIFLHLLANQGLLTWHTVGTPAQRGYFLGAWPHSTAVLVEKEGGGRYAIDSWFHDPGVTAEVVPIKVWKGGWKPAKTREAS